MKLAIVIPCYNEEEVLAETFSQISAQLELMLAAEKLEPTSRAFFVDDGSNDSTWKMIASEAQNNRWVEGIKLSHNKGHQFALLCGLELTAPSYDAAISIDADLQDDLKVMADMLDCHASGSEIVYGVRSSRATDTVFKKFTAQGFYKLMQYLGCDIIYNHADYRLTSQRVLQSLSKYTERNLFLRGVFPHMGYPSETVTYARAERLAGESKYPFLKMLNFAVDGITSFSTRPLRWITALGFGSVCLSVILTVWALVSYMNENVVPGWSSTIVSIYFLGGVQLISVGLIGEYVGKIYTETKARPRYLVETRTDTRENSAEACHSERNSADDSE